MRIVGTWLRIDLRRRWKSLIVLALLVALAGGTVLAALAGARRGASALTRLEDQTLPATAAVLPNQPGFDWSRIERLPEVTSVYTFIVDYAQGFRGLPPGVGWFPTANNTVFRSIEKPVLLAGRAFSPYRPEAVVTAAFAATFHRGVGSTVVLELPTARELPGDYSNGGGALTGPRVRLRVVGVVRTPWFSDGPDDPGSVITSPWVVAHYPASTLGPARGPHAFTFVNALVRLRGGEAAIPRFSRDMARVTGRTDIDVLDLQAQMQAGDRQIVFESRCLIALAGAAFVAALFLIGQSLARYASVGAGDLQIMRGVGMTTGQAVLAAAAGPVTAGLAGAAGATGAAVVASRWFPIGTASYLEPAPGISADWVVLGAALAAIPLLVAGGAMLAAWVALRVSARDAPVRRSTVAAGATRAGLPVPVVVGIRFALEPGRGRAAVPVRPALAGAVIGVLGIVAAFTFSHAVTDTSSHPERFGQTFQLVAETGRNGTDFGPTAKLITALDRIRAVTGVDASRVAVATAAHGTDSVTLYEYAAGRKPVPVVVLSGAMPRGPDQVLLAPRTLAFLHAHVGGRVRLTGSQGPGRYLTVSGSGLVPEGSHNTYADGGWVTGAAYDRLFTGFKYHVVMIALAPGARTADAGATLAARIARRQPALKGLQFEDANTPDEVAELLQVRVLPVVLGIFLALLAAGAVGHALVTVARRRAADIAVLRTLGLTSWNCRLVLATQSAVLSITGLAIGIPAGLAAGRLVWHVVANFTPVQYRPPLDLWVLVAVGPATLLLAAMLAVWPSQRAARLRVARILRTE
jgi:FtsX-like permease family